jgi:hypothetical protein
VPNLKVLDLDSNKKITDNGLSKVPNLKVLDLCNNYKITDNGLSKVPNLKVLYLNLCSKITKEYKLELVKRGVTIGCNNFYSNWKKNEYKYA